MATAAAQRDFESRDRGRERAEEGRNRRRDGDGVDPAHEDPGGARAHAGPRDQVHAGAEVPALFLFYPYFSFLFPKHPWEPVATKVGALDAAQET